jgi:hypothetical protein
MATHSQGQSGPVEKWDDPKVQAFLRTHKGDIPPLITFRGKGTIHLGTPSQADLLLVGSRRYLRYADRRKPTN